jgi:hypothetical protein
MEKQANLEDVEEIQAMLKVMPNEAGAICKEDLQEIFRQ